MKPTVRNIDTYIVRRVMEKYGGEEFLSMYDNEEAVIDKHERVVKPKSSKWWKENVFEKKHSEEEWEAFKLSLRAELPNRLRPLFDRYMPWIDLSIGPKTNASNQL